MTNDDFDVLPPDPVLSGSDGDEAKLIAERRKKGRLVGVAASVGVGSAAIAAAMLFWGQRGQRTTATAPDYQKTRAGSKSGARRSKPSAHSGR
jgi:hypothetical protein